jgi:plasmid maintenance system antidote protein VapI
MDQRKEKKLRPIHPGEVLLDVLQEAGLTPNAVALALRQRPGTAKGFVFLSIEDEIGVTNAIIERRARPCF